MSGACLFIAWLPVCKCYGAFFGDPRANPSTWTFVLGYATGLYGITALREFAAANGATLTRLRTKRISPVYRLDFVPVVTDSVTTGEEEQP
jgi:hypothetical protein